MASWSEASRVVELFERAGRERERVDARRERRMRARGSSIVGKGGKWWVVGDEFRRGGR